MVGNYIKLNTVDDLIRYLDENKLSIDNFLIHPMLMIIRYEFHAG